MQSASRPSTNHEQVVEEHDQFDALPIPNGGDAPSVLAAASRAMIRGHRAAMATVAMRHGSTPATIGQKLLLTEVGECVGTVGGGALERRVLSALVTRVAQPSRGAAESVSYRLGASLGMCCGGTVDVLMESLVPLTPVLLLGAGHIGIAVAPLLVDCGFAVTIADEREEFFERASKQLAIFGERVRCVEDDSAHAARDVPRRGAVIAMTHDHQLDQRVVEFALQEKFAFVGGVGSRAKAARLRTRLVQKGFRAEDLERVRMPVGADIGARSPNEIAVAIVAELIAWRSSSAESD